MIRNLLREALDKLINEVDWSEFDDVSKKCIDPKELANYLNRVNANSSKDYPDREKFGPDKPIIHAKSKSLKMDKDKMDLEHFIREITKPPLSIVGGNDKMSKTGGINEFVYKTGIPALRGVVYDIEHNKFYYINTCPGAGACITICYARKGNYTRYPAAYDSMTRRLNYLLNSPDKYEEQLRDELRQKCVEHKAVKGNKFKVAMRWNDSGDFFSKKYVEIAKRVISTLQGEGYNIEHYVHTKVADVAKDTAFNATSFSLGANKRETDKIDVTKQKVSDIVGPELFKGLDLNKNQDMAKLKTLLAIKLGIKEKFILTYDELMHTPVGKNPIWYVITTPTDGDDAAKRKDVIRDLLIQH